VTSSVTTDCDEEEHIGILRHITATTVIAVSLCAAALPAHGLSGFRTIDGSYNNLSDQLQGAANMPLVRKAGVADYPGDGSGSTIIEPPMRPNTRVISNEMSAQSQSIPDVHHLTDFIWQWGQFVDHDIDLTGSGTGNGTAPIPVAGGDLLAPGPIPFSRSNFAAGTGVPGTPREQVNQITSYIDASNVYGSDDARAGELRSNIGGKLKTSSGNLLALNTGGFPNTNENPFVPAEQLFLSGDMRANEQVGLTAMHTLFMREHNRLADLIAVKHFAGQNLSDPAVDEEIYQTARKIVGAQMQAITYNQFLPAMLGPNAITPYTGYDPGVDASIANEFSAALYRFGHSTLSSQLQLASGGHVELKDAFFNPGLITNDPDIVDDLLGGFASQPMQMADLKVVDAVRNFLFGPPGAGGLDLVALNIQRGRDHGLVGYNAARGAYGLLTLGPNDFHLITSDPMLQIALSNIFGTVDDVDMWVGALAEDHVPGASVGQLIHAGLVDQFTRLRDGDRFFYLNDPDLASAHIASIIDFDRVTLGKIIEWNTSMPVMQHNVFMMVPEPATAGLVLVALAAVIRRRRA